MDICFCKKTTTYPIFLQIIFDFLLENYYFFQSIHVIHELVHLPSTNTHKFMFRCMTKLYCQDFFILKFVAIESS